MKVKYPVAFLMYFIWTAAFAGSAGGELFKNTCATCHAEAGAGMPGFAPPLALVLKQQLNSADAKTYFSQIVISGLSGQIKSDGQIYAGVMPSQAVLSNQDLVAILKYVTTELNEAPVGFEITAEDIESARTKRMSGNDVNKLRQHILKSAN
jgi:mono/diheme cytochrome c family protein